MKISEPKFEFIAGTDRVRLLEDWGVEFREYTIIVPESFETDLASVPRALWPIMAPTGSLRYGGIAHDLAYQHGYCLARYTPARVWPQKSMELRRLHLKSFGTFIPVFVGESQAFFDGMFRDINLAATPGAWNATKTAAAYSALRAFGWIAWNKYRRKGPRAFNQNSLDLPGI